MTAEALLAELCLGAQTENLARVRACVQDAASRAGCNAEQADQLVLAVNEACMNVIQHGYCFAPGQEFLLRVRRLDDALVFELLDRAPPVRPEAVKPRPLEQVRPGGLGVHFIQSIMDEMRFEPGPPGYTNLLRMTKKMGRE